MSKLKIFLALGMVVAILMFVYARISRAKLIKNHKVVSAEVTKCEWLSKGTAKYELTAVFKVNNNFYEAICVLPCTQFSLNGLKKKFLGKKMLIAYHPENPTNNTILLTQTSFDLFNIEVPDSLKWVPLYVECN